MSLRSDPSKYVELCGPRGTSKEDTADWYRRPRAWDTDHDAWQNGALTDLPHAIVTVLPAAATVKQFKQLFAVKGPHFNNVSVYLKSIQPISNLAGGVKPVVPPTFSLDFRIGIPCLCDHWQTITAQFTDYDQAGLLWSGCFPFSQALEVYGGIIPGSEQPANSVVDVRAKFRVVVAYSANDLGVATFESPPSNATNGITVTLSS